MKDALYEAIHTKYLRIFIIMTSGKFFTSLSKQFVDTCLITQVSFLFYKFCKFNFGQNIHINPEPDRLRDITLTSVSFVILVTNCTCVSYYFFYPTYNGGHVYWFSYYYNHANFSNLFRNHNGLFRIIPKLKSEIVDS